MNCVQLLGRLTADPELRYTNPQTAVAKFSLAVPRKVAKGREAVTDFFNIVAWRQKAEFAHKYLRKGERVAVTGELSNRSYEKDGEKRWVTEVIASSIDFADGKRDNGMDGGTFNEEYESMTLDDLNTF